MPPNLFFGKTGELLSKGPRVAAVPTGASPFNARAQPPQGLDATHAGELFPVNESYLRSALIIAAPAPQTLQTELLRNSGKTRGGRDGSRNLVLPRAGPFFFAVDLPLC